MRRGIFIGFSATAALAYLAHRSLCRTIDEAFVWGDVIALPAELTAARELGGEGAASGSGQRTSDIAHRIQGPTS